MRFVLWKKYGRMPCTQNENDQWHRLIVVVVTERNIRHRRRQHAHKAGLDTKHQSRREVKNKNLFYKKQWSVAVDERAGWRARRTDGNSSAAVGLCWMVFVVFRLELNRNLTRRRRRESTATAADASTFPEFAYNRVGKHHPTFFSQIYIRVAVLGGRSVSLFFLPLMFTLPMRSQRLLRYAQWRCYHDVCRLNNWTKRTD